MGTMPQAVRQLVPIDCVSGKCACQRCGRSMDVPDAFTGTGQHLCRAAAAPGLGDMVAAGLSAVGLTKARVQSAAKAVGVKDCGCANRQAMLNRLGAKLGLPPGQT